MGMLHIYIYIERESLYWYQQIRQNLGKQLLGDYDCPKRQGQPHLRQAFFESCTAGVFRWVQGLARSGISRFRGGIQCWGYATYL